MPNKLLENNTKVESVEEYQSLAEKGGIDLSDISTAKKERFIAHMKSQEIEARRLVWSPGGWAQ